MIQDYAALALRNLAHRGRRSWLTVVGIFIGIAAVVALVSLGQGLQGSVEAEFERIGSDKLFINPGGDQTQGQISTGLKLTGDDLSAVLNSRGVDDAAGVVFVSSPAQFRDEQAFVMVLGMPTDDSKQIVESSWAMTIEEGREIRRGDTSSVVIGSQVASGAFPDDLGLRSRLTIQGETFRVVGIMEATGDPGIDRSVIMPIDTARSLTDREEDTYDWIFARMEPGLTPVEVEDAVERSLRQSRDVAEGEEDFTVSTQEELLESFNQILGVVRGVVIGIASISIFVGGVGIMNTMYTSVTERTREIGVMKAVGATNEQIMALFLIESGVIGLVGGGLGAAFGITISALAAFGATQATGISISPYVGPELVAGSLFFAFIVGTVSGVFPARAAAGLQPADALRYE